MALPSFFFGGEATSEGQVKMLRSHNGKLQISNVYGADRNYDVCNALSYRCRKREDSNRKTDSEYNSICYEGRETVRDRHAWRIMYRRDGVARGYLNKPELTKERFIENPYVPGERIYRTGDLVRWLPDGNLEYLSRIDEQVKIRGFRIELGEIESRLREIDGVKEAAVVALDDGTGKYLSAYP